MARLWAVVLWATLLLLPFAVLCTVNGVSGPSVAEHQAFCTRYCHSASHGCPHTAAKFDFEQPGPKLARRVFLANIRLLGSTSLGYQNTNLVVYVLAFPAACAGLLLAVLWPTRTAVTPSRARWFGLVVLLGSALAGLAVFPITGGLTRWGWSLRGLYWFCTDFCIHAGNGTTLTYDAFNFLLFTVAFPLTLLGLPAILFLKLLWIRAQR